MGEREGERVARKGKKEQRIFLHPVEYFYISYIVLFYINLYSSSSLTYFLTFFILLRSHSNHLTYLVTYKIFEDCKTILMSDLTLDFKSHRLCLSTSQCVLSQTRNCYRHSSTFQTNYIQISPINFQS